MIYPICTTITFAQTRISRSICDRVSYLTNCCSRPGTSWPPPARSGCPSSKGWSAARSAASIAFLLHLCCCHFSMILNLIISNFGNSSPFLPVSPSRWRGRREATIAASCDNAPCSGRMASQYVTVSQNVTVSQLITVSQYVTVSTSPLHGVVVL